MRARYFIGIFIFVMGISYIILRIFGALFSVPGEFLLLIWFAVLAATIYLLLTGGGKKSHSEREQFTHELRKREAERKSPTPELINETIVTKADTSVSPICTDCGKNNPPEAVHCMGCGKKLSQSTCPECETENLPKAKFCMGCGVKR